MGKLIDLSENEGGGGGSSDPWTVLTLASDFATSEASNQNVPNLLFTPQAGRSYLWELHAILQTSDTAIGARVGMQRPSNFDHFAGQIHAPSSQTVNAVRNLSSAFAQAGANVVASAIGFTYADADMFAFGKGMLIAGGSPSGDLQTVLRSETAANEVRMMAGSVLLYREV